MATHVYEYYEIGDAYDPEGKGPWQTIARITDQHEAKLYSRSRGNYNRDAQVRPVKVVVVDTADEMKEYQEEEKRQRALDKLTAEEKKLLGL